MNICLYYTKNRTKVRSVIITIRQEHLPMGLPR